MAKQVRLRRGTTAQHSSFTGAAGEVTVDTDKKVVVVHDGATVGGVPMFPSTGGTVSGSITSTSTVTAGDGFMTTTYTSGVRNPIWRFGNSTTYGISYFQGAAGYNGTTDSIGFHFGTATAAGSILNVTSSGVIASGDLVTQLPSASNGTLRGIKYGVLNDTTNYGSAGMNINTGEVRYTAGFSGWGGFHTWYLNGGEVMRLDTSGHLLPAADNTYNHGSASFAIKQIYSNNSIIVTSDARLKTTRAYLDAEKAVAKRIKNLGRVYQWNSAIAEKGPDQARLHFGTTVQDVIAAFQAEGLDPFRYGVVCYDEWEEKIIEHPEVRAEDDTIETEAWTEVIPAGNKYSLRLDQLTWFVLTAAQ
jgi:Major tropism determinant N-terminal domain/Chaperone of endosialidase